MAEERPKKIVTCFKCKAKNDVPSYPPAAQLTYFPWVCSNCKTSFEYSDEEVDPFTRPAR